MIKKSVLMFLMFGVSVLTFSQFTVDKSDVTGVSSKPQGPEWMNNAVFYEIYPQTFYDSNGDGVGDLQGIIQKLDYVKSLGTTAIWLNPFYESPFRDAGYDVSDFYKVAPRYGTNADAKQLFDEIHKRGMKVIIDYVPGHTSVDHPWFKESAKAEKNKYSNWYIWTDNTWSDGMDRRNYNFIQGFSERDGCFLTNFFWHQPALNYGFAKPDPTKPWQLGVNHPDVLALKKEMENVLRFWLEMGSDGFRVDMAGSLVKNDTEGECSKYWNDLRKRLEKDYPDLFLVSEWSNPKAALRGGFHADFFHWFNGYNDLFVILDGGKPFFDARGQGNISRVMSLYMDQYNSTKDLGYISMPFANHDLSRICTEGRTANDIEIIYAFELTMPGIPFLYYGDEIGMKQLFDLPFTEGSYGARAGNRTPMQWNSGLNKGFSSAPSQQLYRVVDASNDAPNVADSEKGKESLLNKVRQLIKLRNVEPALKAFAEFVPVYVKEKAYPFAFIRATGKNRLLIVLNPANKVYTAKFSINYDSASPVLIAGSPLQIQKNGKEFTVQVNGATYSIYRLNEK